MTYRSSKSIIAELAGLIERLAAEIMEPDDMESLGKVQQINREARELSRAASLPFAPTDADTLPDRPYPFPDAPPLPCVSIADATRAQAKATELLITLRAALPEIRAMVNEVMRPAAPTDADTLPDLLPGVVQILTPSHVRAECLAIKDDLQKASLIPGGYSASLASARLRLNTLLDHIDRQRTL